MYWLFVKRIYAEKHCFVIFGKYCFCRRCRYCVNSLLTICTIYQALQLPRITCGFCYVLGLSVFLVFCSKALVSLQCLEDSVNFGDIVVGSSASRELTIHNNSDCSLHYNLFIDQEVTGPYDDDQTARDVLGKLLFPYYTSEVYPLDIKHLMTGPSGNS